MIKRTWIRDPLGRGIVHQILIQHDRVKPSVLAVTRILFPGTEHVIDCARNAPIVQTGVQGWDNNRRKNGTTINSLFCKAPKGSQPSREEKRKSRKESPSQRRKPGSRSAGHRSASSVGWLQDTWPSKSGRCPTSRSRAGRTDLRCTPYLNSPTLVPPLFTPTTPTLRDPVISMFWGARSELFTQRHYGRGADFPRRGWKGAAHSRRVLLLKGRRRDGGDVAPILTLILILSVTPNSLWVCLEVPDSTLKEPCTM